MAQDMRCGFQPSRGETKGGACPPSPRRTDKHANSKRLWRRQMVAPSQPGTLVTSDSSQPLLAYLAALPGTACTFPLKRVRELAGATLPDAARSPAWWRDEAGRRACPASRACLAAGWRLESVHAAAGLVRMRTGDESPGGAGRDPAPTPRHPDR